MVFKPNLEFASRMPNQRIIGEGKPAGKSSQLISDTSALFSSGLRVPDSITFTPAFFRRILDDSGALKEGNSKNAGKLIQPNLFNKTESDAIADAILLDPVFSKQPLIIRLDDFAAGLGLSESIVVGAKKNEKELVEEVKAAICTALSSAFSADFIEFRRIKGLSAYSSGILIMPVVGERFRIKKTNFIAPAISLNFIGKDQDHSALLQVGAGFAGANSRNSAKNVIEKYVIQPYYIQRAIAKGSLNAINIQKGVQSIGYEYFDSIKKFVDNDILTKSISRLESSIYSFLKQVGTRYMEIASVLPTEDIWGVVQTSALNIPEIQKPQLKYDSEIATTTHVLGTHIKNIDKVRLARFMIPEDSDLTFNSQNKDYLLIIGPTSLQTFKECWRLSSYSNAGAIAVIVNDIAAPVFSHLGGLLRELNIPLLAIEDGFTEKGQRLIDHLIVNRVQQKKLLVFADEFNNSGCIAEV